MDISCPICITTTIDVAECPFCEFECCVSCCKTYILNIEEKCMSCFKLYSRNIVLKILGSEFFDTEYKRHLELITHKSEEIELTKLCAKLSIIINAWETENPGKQFLVEIDKTKNLEEIEKELAIDLLIGQLLDSNEEIDKEPIISKEIIACRDCLGSMKIIDGKFQCLICRNIVCPTCRESFSENHECDPSIIASIQLLERDTKPCPRCGNLIHKIEGCNHMWDPQCQTAFSWDTLEILKGKINNPHYYDYTRTHDEIPQKYLERLCQDDDELPDFIQIDPEIDELYSKALTVWNVLKNKDKWFSILKTRLFLLRCKYTFRVISSEDFFQKCCRILEKIDYLKEAVVILDEYRLLRTGLIKYIYSLFLETDNFTDNHLSDCIKMIDCLKNELREISEPFVYKFHPLPENFLFQD